MQASSIENLIDTSPHAFFRYLPATELGGLAKVSHSFNNLIENSLWKEKLEADIGPAAKLIEPGELAKDAYIRHSDVISRIAEIPLETDLHALLGTYPNYHLNNILSDARFTYLMKDYIAFCNYAYPLKGRSRALIEIMLKNDAHFVRIIPTLFVCKQVISLVPAFTTSILKKLLSSNKHFFRINPSSQDIYLWITKPSNDITSTKLPIIYDGSVLELLINNESIFARLFTCYEFLRYFIYLDSADNFSEIPAFFSRDPIWSANRARYSAYLAHYRPKFIQKILDNEIYFTQICNVTSLPYIITDLPDYAERFITKILDNDALFTRIIPNMDKLIYLVVNLSSDYAARFRAKYNQLHPIAASEARSIIAAVEPLITPAPVTAFLSARAETTVETGTCCCVIQ